jgi:hypothetical protein
MENKLDCLRLAIFMVDLIFGSKERCSTQVGSDLTLKMLD